MDFKLMFLKKLTLEAENIMKNKTRLYLVDLSLHFHTAKVNQNLAVLKFSEK